jgi:hypothetical protein
VPSKDTVPAYDRMRRIGLAVSPNLAQSMRVLGLAPEADPENHTPADGATQITAALGHYADAVERANAELDQVLSRAEWNMMADVLGGCANLWDFTESSMSALFFIRAEVEDAQRLDGAGDKWFGEELERGSGDKAVKALLKKLAAMSYIHGDAIMAAIRHFWRYSRTIDHSRDIWWTVDCRAPRERKGSIHAGNA